MSGVLAGTRISLKIAGASGQGVNSTGPLLARGLKRVGYCVFGYREYPSLIQGGHSTYQVDVSSRRLCSSECDVNILAAFNHHGLELNTPDLKPGGFLLHVTPEWTFSPEHARLIDERGLRVAPYPVFDVLRRLGGPPVVANVLLAAIVWTVLGLDPDALKELVSKTFAKKQDLLQINLRCIDEGQHHVKTKLDGFTIPLPEPDPVFADQLLLTGSEAMGLGAIHAGVRLFAGYPMTPVSPLQTYISACEHNTHMVVKQAEDEMTAAQMVSGAMWMGTRALTATAGVGFDLMTETISMNAMMENPMVVVLGQRPGPATGLPTWTAQTGLLPAVGGAHGEFTRCVLAASNSQDAFDLMPMAFNLAEEYQIPVIILTDKQIAEGLYTQRPYDLDRAEVRRGLVSETELAALTATDRYDPDAVDGISARWLPGSEAVTYCAQADEHDAAGAVKETSANTSAQIEKRMRKHVRLRAEIPRPEVLRSGTREHDSRPAADPIDLLLVGWGSTREVMLDVLDAAQLRDRSIAYLHYTCLWPLNTEDLLALAARARRLVLVEQNHQGQLGMLIGMHCGLQTPHRILKYDGRPFFYDELLARVAEEEARATHAEPATGTVDSAPL